MTLSARDKKIVTFLLPVMVLFGYWFLLLSPQRQAASEAATTLEAEQARLAEAEAHASTVQAAKANFARDYAAVVALGKAIPTSVDMPSLLVQLEQAANGTGIELKGLTVGERTTVADPAAAAAPAVPGAPDPAAAGTAPSGAAPQSAPGAAAASAQGAADAASTPAPTTDASGTATAPTDPAAAGTTAATPAGSALESVSLEFNFEGHFFELADFFHSLKRFVFVDGDKVRVRGRLMTIDAVEYQTEAENFPALTATVTATVYLTPKSEGATAGATPAGPPTTPSAATPVTTASDGSTSPTPTATATP
jgi:hypothetical protein